MGQNTSIWNKRIFSDCQREHSMLMETVCSIHSKPMRRGSHLGTHRQNVLSTQVEEACLKIRLAVYIFSVILNAKKRQKHYHLPMMFYLPGKCKRSSRKKFTELITKFNTMTSLKLICTSNNFFISQQ